MKRTFLVLIVLINMLSTNSLIAQNIDLQPIVGSWIGKITASAVPLRVIFNISLSGKDSLEVTLDSPDQGAKNIKIGPVSFNGKALKILAPLLLGEYNGILNNDTLIEGTWKQAGRTMDLNLTKMVKPFTLNRPQEPKPPYPYTSEDVTFTNDVFNIRLAGTVTIPLGDGPFPAVVLITGSGPQNRNEELMGHKPFLVIADYLSRHGIAVLRYDDRGVGQSQGLRTNTTSKDLATDAEAAFEFLKTMPGIDHRKIGLAGHSEGGLIAIIVAASNPDVTFIISLACPGVTGEQILYKQVEDIIIKSGGSEKQVKEALSTNKELYTVLKKEPDNKKATEKMNAVYKKILVSEKTDNEKIDEAMKQFNLEMNPGSLDWWRYFIITNPAAFWKKIKCPVLALNGEKDIQVAADVNLPAIAKALKSGGNKSVTTVKLPELNHLFQHCKTGLPKEYGEIEETFSPDVLKIMADWINLLK
jgi:pimeloyl-ACP methyl ester carboxylesterase